MNSKTLNIVTFMIALLCVAIPCFAIQGQYLVNGNISWLLMAAERLLSGQSMSEHIYETNPPLSIIIYTPHVLFAKFIGWPLPVASFYITSIFVTISIAAIYAIIKHLPHFTEIQRLGFLVCYALSITVITTVFYSDREHLILLGLAPFVLCQFALAERINLPRTLIYIVCTVGALCVLIKPHYGLLPTIFLVSRLIKHKQFNVLKQPDFIALSVMTVLYVATVFIFFGDYIHVILPDVMALYANSGSDFFAILNASQIHMVAYLSLFLLEVFREDLKKEHRTLVLFFYTCCLLSMVPYYVQMKGFYNHLVPAYAFFMMGFGSSIMFRVEIFSKKIPAIQIIIPFFCLLSIANAVSPLNMDFPEHKDIPKLPVAMLLEQECKKPCTFFAFHGDIEIMNPTAALMGYRHGTRFPSLWFLPQVMEGLRSDNPEKKETAQKLKEKYSTFIAEDLEFYKPSVLLIAADLPIGILPAFNFMKFFGSNQKLRNIIEQNYEKTEPFEFDRAQYFKGTTLEWSYILKFDVYKRIQTASP